jgi:predicted Ser/Thr protein kinase
MTDFVGKTLGPYKLEDVLGKGGMASVYRAYQSSVKRYVAIKVMSPDIGGQPGFVERFAQEAEVIASLEHPHIVPVIDYGTQDNLHYLVMRYIEGGSLEDRMRKGSLSLQEAARFLAEMASALTYAHKRGVVHRDLKPNNMLIDGSDNLYLTDFGIARLTQSEHHLTATGSVMGTPAYMSPEQGMGQRVDSRSDIYTLGVVLYEMVLNRLPFSGETPAAMIFQHVYEHPAHPQKVNPNLPDAVADVLNKSMAKNPDERYQSASEMSSAFAEAIRSTKVTPLVDDLDMVKTYVGGPKGSQTSPRTMPQRPTPSGAGRSPMTIEHAGTGRKFPVPLIAGIAVLAVVLIGGALFLITKGNADAAVHQTNTAVAVIALSATATSTNTPVATATVPTRTPNIALTQFAQQMAQTGTAAQIQIRAATQTQAAKPTKTPIIPTKPPTVRPSATKIPPTTSNTSNSGFNGAPEDVIAQLVSAGAVSDASGQLSFTADKIDVAVDKPSFENWETADVNAVLSDFVVSATFTWEAPDVNNECGILIRYTPADSGQKNWRYYLISLGRRGGYQAFARDEGGYRKTAFVQKNSALVNADNNAINQLLVIAKGSHFDIYVNGSYAEGFDDPTFKSGRIAVIGTRFEKSTGLLCKFRNVWAWSLK